LFEIRQRPDSKYVGCTLREADLPPNTLVVSIQRDTDTIFPMAATRLEAGDVLTILADPALEAQVRELFDGWTGAMRQAVETLRGTASGSGGGARSSVRATRRDQ
jgi:NhaP-type Na+/H+ and K+/H+ antiporter